MGKKFLYYCPKEEIIKKFDKEENKSQLITDLLTDYYNKDLEFLNNEKQILTEKLTVNEMRIKGITEKIEQIKKLDEEKRIKENKALKEKQLAEAIKKLWRDDKITEKQFWSSFDGGDLNIKKARKILDGINKKTT